MKKQYFEDAAVINKVFNENLNEDRIKYTIAKEIASGAEELVDDMIENMSETLQEYAASSMDSNENKIKRLKGEGDYYGQIMKSAIDIIAEDFRLKLQKKFKEIAQRNFS